jgi:hypothetical protein
MILWEKLLNIKCVSIFSSNFIQKTSSFKNNSARYYHKCTYIFIWRTRYSCHTFENLVFLVIFSEITQVSNLIKIRSVGAELFHTYRKTDGRTDMTKQIIAFRNFSKAPTNRPISRHLQKRKECCVWTNYTHSSYKTRCSYISNIFNGAGEGLK